MLSNYIISAIRTYVPIGVGFVLTWLAARQHIVIDPASQVGLVALLTASLSAAYWSLVRALEKWRPEFGWLLGSPAQPNYTGTTDNGIDIDAALKAADAGSL